MKITPSIQTFILNWSAIAGNWGMNRTVAQIHALLLLSSDPLTADEIKSLLQVARSNVSVSIKELQSWSLIDVVTVMGDRKKRYAAYKDMKEVFRRIMRERKKREVESSLQLLEQCKVIMSSERINREAKSQLEDLTDVFKKLDSFYGGLIDDV